MFPITGHISRDISRYIYNLFAVFQSSYVADKGTASSYALRSHVHSTRGYPTAWQSGEVLTTPHHKNLNMLQITHRGFET